MPSNRDLAKISLRMSRISKGVSIKPSPAAQFMRRDNSSMFLSDLLVLVLLYVTASGFQNWTFATCEVFKRTCCAERSRIVRRSPCCNITVLHSGTLVFDIFYFYQVIVSREVLVLDIVFTCRLSSKLIALLRAFFSRIFRLATFLTLSTLSANSLAFCRRFTNSSSLGSNLGFIIITPFPYCCQ